MAATCSVLYVAEDCVKMRIFWVMTSRVISAFNAYWLGSGYMYGVSVYEALVFHSIWWSRRAENCGVSQLQFSDTWSAWRCRRYSLAVMDVAVITQRQVGVSRTVEVPQIQFLAPFEDIPVAQQRRVRTVQAVHGVHCYGRCDVFFCIIFEAFSPSVSADVLDPTTRRRRHPTSKHSVHVDVRSWYDLASKKGASPARHRAIGGALWRHLLSMRMSCRCVSTFPALRVGCRPQRIRFGGPASVSSS